MAEAKGRHLMRVGPASACHLTYCTNIHPGETWDAVRANLERYLPAVKERVSPERDFGVGLRLSAAAAQDLRREQTFAEFVDFLAGNGLYVFTINGFPHGKFHGARVKEDVYLPDWQDDERVHYTNLLADHLARLLPAGDDMEGSISTVPGAFKPRVTSPAHVERMASQMVACVANLVRLREKTGRVICLALEPEPCCFLETIDETVAFFEGHLFGQSATERLMRLTGLGAAAAGSAMRRHMGVCLDTCHAAVEFEDPADAVTRLHRAGIKIAKLQLSAGLRVERMAGDLIDALSVFRDDVYLHQVVERHAGELTRYLDLPEALDAIREPMRESEWRIHFHVPIFLADLPPFSSTQPFLEEILARHQAEPVSPHLEVETYTWDVLPDRYKSDDVVAAIARELTWASERLTP